MQHPIRTLVQEFGWAHTGIGLIGNATFLTGSVFFLPAFEPWKTFGVWLFIVGASLMLVGSLGDVMVKIYEARARAERESRQEDEGRRPEERAAA
ncbi:MAG: YrhK family protein [Kiloniellaceae bacterium]